jgi:hypothetical protein
MTESENTNSIKRKTSDIIKDTTCSIAAGLSALATNDRNDNILSASRIFQGVVKGRGLEQLRAEWDDLKEKGKIKDDYESTSQHRDCLLELLNFLDNDCPDELRFQTLKKLFLVAATEIITDRDSLLPYQFLKLCREMTSGEIVVLQTAYKLANQPNIKRSGGAVVWLRMVADASGLTHTSLVEIHEEKLTKKYLLTGRVYSDRSGVECEPHFRLTELAYDFCKYVANYDQTTLGI